MEIDVPEYLTVYADELKIGQIITNYLTNAIKHSPKGKTIRIRAWQKEDEETVRMEVEEDPKTVVITFADHGVPYDPLAKEDPDVTLSLNDREIGGLGIFMVKKSMDDMIYAYENGQNVLTIRKRIG